MLRYLLVKFRALSSSTTRLKHCDKRSCSCCFGALVILWVGLLLVIVAVMRNQFLLSSKSQSGFQTTSKSLPSLNNEAERKKLRIVFCSYVVSETPYLLEWIEFHRLQGVDKFVFYYDILPSNPASIESAMQIDLLAAFYRDEATRMSNRNTSVDKHDENHGGKDFVDSGLNGVGNDLIEVLPGPALLPDLWDSFKSLDSPTYDSMFLIQRATSASCLQRYRDKAEYIMHLDIDEFVYSPQHETMWDFLQYRKKQQRWTSFIHGKTAGFHVPCINFGSAGVFWNFRTFLEKNYIPGRVNAYYDPRDSSLFRFLQHLNYTSSAEQARKFSPLEFAEQLDAFRSSRLKEVPFLNDVPELAEYVHQRLLRDFPPSDSSQPFVDTLSIPQLRSSVKASGNSSLSVLGDYFVSVFSQLEQKPSLSVEDVGHLDRLSRAEIYRHYIQRSSLFYPLLIEEQVGRLWYSDLHETRKKSKAMEKYPACRIPNVDRRAYLVEKEGFEPGSVALQRTLDTYNSVCKGDAGAQLTDVGKTIYVTSAMKGNPRLRSSGRLKGCHQAHNHVCAHWTLGSRLERPDPTRELRLDHHQFRSYEKRSFGLPAWRGGPLGYPHEMNYTLVQQNLGSVVDTGKLRFIPKLRERLSQLGVTPKMFDYVWSGEDDNKLYHIWNVVTRKKGIGESWISRQNITSTCSAIELLGEQQAMCPPKYPYVGYVRLWPGIYDGYNPYCWCSDRPMNSAVDPARQALYTLGLFPNEKHVDSWVLFQEHTVFCPGYGVAPCCDYDPNLLAYQSPEFLNQPPKLWADIMTDVERKMYHVGDRNFMLGV